MMADVTISASKLRENIYQILDRVLATGRPVLIHRKGKLLRIVAEPAPDRLQRLKRRPRLLRGDPEDIVHLDWSRYWKPRR